VSVKIAIIEDNPDNRMLFEALLSDSYEIDEYEDGLAGLEGMRATPPAVALLDISLPGMTGSEVLLRMREDPKLADIPVVALTAHAMPGDRENYLSQGFDAYVAKPIVDESLLIDEIERLLGGRR
jgi:two-component system cell cycle response regulator DivK